MRAMVLAAGRGERLRPITDTTPKPMVPVGGRPLIEWHLEALARGGFRDIVINLSWLGECIRAALGDGARYGVDIRYSEEGPTALEVGGGIFKALPLLGPGPFLVVNGDTWTDIDFAALAARAESGMAAAVTARIVFVANPPQHPRGDFALEGERVVEREHDCLTYSGVGVYRPEFFAGCTAGKFPLAPLLRRAIATGQLRGELHRGEWWDAGTPERLAALDKRLGGGM